MIKFAGDGEQNAHILFEHAYVQAAVRFGIQTMPSTLVEAGSHVGICVDRFDRQNGQKQHVHSMAGMMHVTHRVSNADWTHVASILNQLEHGESSFEEAFRRAVFNAAFCVRDDHTKNIAFIRRPSNHWALTPAYDISYADGPGGYHPMTYAGHIKENVSFNDLLKLAPFFEVEPALCREWAEKALDSQKELFLEATSLGLSKTFLKPKKERLDKISKDLKIKLTTNPKTL